MTDTNDTNANPTGLGIGHIFLVGAGFKHRDNLLEVPANTRVGPQQITVGIQFGILNEGEAYFVQLTVNSVQDDPAALYDFSVTMGGIFEQGPAVKELSHREIMEIGGTILFPFLRETVANLTQRGRFGPVWLNPFNVRALAQSAEQNESAESENPAP
jgi:preprotein translocase subunit SecB